MRHAHTAFLAAFGWCACLHGGQLARCDQVGGTNSKPEPAGVCTDSQGGTYSPGAQLEIGGKRMECVIGPHWVPVGSASTDSGADILDVGDTNLAVEFEAATLAAFNKSPLPILKCDAVLNAAQGTSQLTRVPVGEKRLLMFWTPTCGPCKPLLADLSALGEKRPHGLSLLGIVQSVDSELETPGEWALLRVKQLLARYKVGFPTCVHSSSDQMKRWHAQGVPLTLLLSHDGVERVAAGARNGQRLVAELGGTLVK
jgi:thiol-disulfide isomerase/thioredoxin